MMGALPARLGTALLLVALATATAAAQEAPWRVGAGAGFELYSFGDEAELQQISLLTTPFAARADVGDIFDLTVSGAWARGAATLRGGDELELLGPTDTEARLGVDLADRAVRLELVGYLPTGETTHDAAEATVAGIVAADVLPFRISHWGAGGSVAMSASGARSFGAFGAGLNVSYRLSHEFDPVAGEDFRYQPGDELRVRVALNFDVTRAQRLSLAVGYRSFETDVANDRNLFQTGDRLEVVSTWSFPTSFRSAAALYGGWIHREGGTFVDTDGAGVPAQDLVLLGGVLRAPFAGGFILPRVDARVFQPDAGSGGGYVVGAGASLEMPVGQTLTLVPSLTGRVGAVEFAEDRGFFGVDAGLTLRFGPGSR